MEYLELKIVVELFNIFKNSFKEMKSTDITGKDCNKSSGNRFNPKRLIIIEIFETKEQKRIREENENKMIEKNV